MRRCTTSATKPTISTNSVLTTQDPLDVRVVVLLDAGQQHAAEPGQGEDALDDDGAEEGGRQLDAEDRR